MNTEKFAVCLWWGGAATFIAGCIAFAVSFYIAGPAEMFFRNIMLALALLVAPGALTMAACNFLRRQGADTPSN